MYMMYMYIVCIFVWIKMPLSIENVYAALGGTTLGAFIGNRGPWATLNGMFWLLSELWHVDALPPVADVRVLPVAAHAA